VNNVVRGAPLAVAEKPCAPLASFVAWIVREQSAPRAPHCVPSGSYAFVVMRSGSAIPAGSRNVACHCVRIVRVCGVPKASVLEVSRFLVRS